MRPITQTHTLPLTSLVHSEFRLRAVLATGMRAGSLHTSAVVNRILGLLTFDPDTLLTVRGLLELISLCKGNKRLNAFLNCNDRTLWREVLVVADEKTRPRGEIDVLEKLNVIDEKTNMLVDDDAAALLYKRAVIRHVLFYALYDDTCKTEDGVFICLMELVSQVETFLARTNGSFTNIVKVIKYETARLRRRGREYPHIPSDFFVAAIRLVAEVTNMRSSDRRYYQKGRPRLDDLCDHVRSHALYY